MAGTSGVVVSQANAATPAIGSIFDGKAFFISQRVPSRNTYIEKIRANGGRHVKLEGQADYLIADHLRKDNPSNSISYTFIDAAIRDSALPDRKDHVAGPVKGTSRTIGSTVVAPKGTRTAFTAEDDRELWSWVEGKLRAGEGTAKGNEIYKQLEAMNPRHTFQAWRDRYIKKLMNRPPDGVETSDQGQGREQQRPKAAKARRPNGERDRNTAQDDEQHGLRAQEGQQEPEQDGEQLLQPELDPRDMGPFETSLRAKLAPPELEDLESLLSNAPDIQNLEHDDYEQGWVRWAERFPMNTAEEYREFYQECVLPVYLERQKVEHRKEAMERHREEHETHQNAEQNGETSTHHGSKARVKKGKLPTMEMPSPEPQKRKRETPTPRRQTYGSKRAKQDNSDIFALDDDEENELARPIQRSASTVAQALRNASTKSADAVIDPAGNSAEDSTQEHQLGSKTSNSMIEDVLPTFEANRAARKQLMAEAHVEEALPTSEANRAAQTQLTAEAEQNERQPIDDEIETAVKFPVAAQVEPIEADDAGSVDGTPKSARWHTGLFADKQARAPSNIANPPRTSSVPGSSSPNAEDASQGDALTEANLASQQQQHQAQLLRGVDLRADDEEADQTAFANDLAALLGVKQKINPPPEKVIDVQDVPDRLMDTPEEEGGNAIEIASEGGASEDEDETLLLGDGTDVDKIFTQSRDWPMSPQKPTGPERTQKQQQRGFTVETQVQYPDLTQHHNLREGQDEDEEGSSQPFGYPELKEAEKPVWRDEEMAFSSQAGTKDIAEAEEASTPTQLKMDSRLHESDGLCNGVPAVDHGNNAQDDNHDQSMDEENNEVDLTVPPPEDGFSGDEGNCIERVTVKPEFQRLNQMISQRQNGRGYTNEPIEISSQDTPHSSSLLDEDDGHYNNGTASTDQRNANTQVLFDAETQQPELNVPLPPDSDQDEELELPSYHPAQFPESRPRFRLPAGLEESDPDPSLPQLFPPGGLFAKSSSKPSPASANIRPSTSHRQPLPLAKPSKRKSPPAPKRTPKPTPKPKRQSFPKASAIPSPENESLDDFITRMISASHPPATIAKALQMTSMNQRAAEMVVYLLKAGKPLPRHTKEIWTEEQDQVALGGDSVAIRRLVEGTDQAIGKGWEEFEQRVEFLMELGEG